jgi:hypothetical protein
MALADLRDTSRPQAERLTRGLRLLACIDEVADGMKPEAIEALFSKRPFDTPRRVSCENAASHK